MAAFFVSIFCGGNVNLYRAIFLFLGFTVFVGCSSTHKAYLQTMKLAFQSSSDPTLTLAEIQSSPVDLLYIRLNDKPRAVLALAYIENSNYKWVSGDNAMLVEKGGRIIRTVGMIDHFNYVTNIENDPLSTLNDISNHATWNRFVDYGNNQNASVRSLFEYVANSELMIDGNLAKASLLKEVVTFYGVNEKPDTWTNYYWFDSETKQLLKSKQKISPDSDKYELTYVSRIARLPLAPILNIED
ncbi:YjbF family lipoprotein [Paraglaciecola sp. 2405UD69-4]|uniref:YjbF family lipoprotein n=1 Tax=Paraglaciecola sp. 2405UD69-4 TaxID=3391836 RepID=UPI0039C957AA